MADTDTNQMTDADVSAAANVHTAAPDKGPTVDEGGTLGSKTAEAKQAIKDNASKYGAQATDKVRSFADTGKQKAGETLNQVSTLIDEAATQVDERLGAQYGDYARSAATQLSAFSTKVQDTDIDVLIDEARDFVRKSPVVAIGVAAALGFVAARLVQSGIDTKA